MRWTAVVAVVSLGLVACSGDNATTSPTTPAVTPAPTPTTTAAPAAAPKFRFGFVAPGAPLLIDLAYAQENALSLAVDDINAGGGVLGAPVKAITTDDRTAGSVPQAVDDLVDGGANAILGPVGSTDALAAIPAVAGRKSLACSGSATLTDLNTSAPQATFFRTALPDQHTVDFVAQQILATRDATAPGGPWKVAIVARGDDYGTSVSTGLASILTSQGVETSVVTYLPEQTSLGAEARQVAALAPNTVVAVTYEEAPRLLDQLVIAGVPAPSIIGLDAMFMPNLARMTFPSDPAKLDGMTVIGITGDRAFLRRLNALPSGQVLFGPQLYDCAIVIALAAEAARSSDPAVYGQKLNAVLTGDRPCSTYADCRAKLAAGESIAYTGQIGTFHFDDTGSPTASRFTVANLANGNFVVAKTVSVDLAADAKAQAAELAVASAVQTARLQQVLTALGLYSGPIDGVPSDALTASIVALQQQLGVPVTGVYDAATDAALRARGSTAVTALNTATASLQQALTDLGFYTGPIDGTMSAATVAAIRALQATLGVPQTGVVDAATIRAVYERGAASVPVPPPTTEPPSTAPPSTAPPTTVPPSTAPPSTAPPSTAPPTTEAPTTTKAPATTVAPTTTTAPPESNPDIITALDKDGRFTTYLDLVRRAGLTGSLAILGPVTVFAPTDEAFAALPAGALDALRSDPVKLEALLLGAMVKGRLTAADLQPGASLTTLAGTTVTVAKDGSTITVGGAAVAPPELDAANGIVQPLGSVPSVST